MGPTLQIVTTCTDRKKFPVESNLRAQSLPRASISDLAAIWHERLQNQTDRWPAAEMYAGRSFREAESAAMQAGCELRIISAGLGFVSASDAIPAYGLTLVHNAADSVRARVIGPFDAPTWWRLMQQQAANPLTALMRRHRMATLAIGLTRTYANLVIGDLMHLGPAERGRLRIVGLSIFEALPQLLRHCVLPYDDRLDGPQSSIRGTRGDFSSRALRHFATVIWPTNRGADLHTHKQAVAASLRGWKPAPRFARQLKSDREIIDVIIASIPDTGGQSGRTLRYLRDVKGIACEQGRFKGLLKQALQAAAR